MNKPQASGQAGQLRAAIIGCGAIAYEHMPYLAQMDGGRCVALCDRSQAMAEALGEHFESDAAIYTDAAEMLASETPDIVHILTPPQTHDMLVRQALAAGAHVVCEKPMTGTAPETEGLLEAARQADRVLVESRNLLFNDPVLELLAMRDAGTLGEVRECDIVLSLDFLGGPFGDLNLSGAGAAIPGGAVHDFLPHLVYLWQALTGYDMPDRITGELSNKSGNARAGFDYLDALLLGNGPRGRFRVATDVEPAAFRVTLRGSEGCVETDLYNPYMRFEGEPDTGKRYPIGQIRGGLKLARAGIANLRNKIGGHGTTHGLPRMLEQTYTAIIEGKDPPNTHDQMLATARLTDRIIALADANSRGAA